MQLHPDKNWYHPFLVDPDEENQVWSRWLGLGEEKWRDRHIVAG
jgi:hypothetical protein